MALPLVGIRVLWELEEKQVLRFVLCTSLRMTSRTNHRSIANTTLKDIAERFTCGVAA